MQNLFSTPSYKHVLLLGASGVGKTKFLYENLLQNKFKDKLNPSEGYNVENYKIEPKNYALWDLSAREEFLQLWPVFYNYIPFDALIFVFRILPTQRKKEKLKLGNESWGESRKIFKYLIVEEAFKDKPILLLINNIVQGEAKETVYENFTKEVKEYLGWDELVNEHKDIVSLDVNDYMEHETVYTKLHKLHNAKYGDD